MNTTNTTAENKQSMTTKNGNWMTGLAGLLFWVTVGIQILMLMHNIQDEAFTDFIIFNVLPIAGVLAYLGVRREQKVRTNRNDECSQTPDSNC